MMMIAGDAAARRPCTLLEWDSTFFGVRIARVDGTRHTDATVAAAVEWGATQAIDCLYLLADAAHDESLRAAERHGFLLADIRSTLTCAVQHCHAGATACVRPAAPRDLDALIRIARTSHHDTRFYTDPRFGRDRADDLYETWMVRSIRGELADEVWVADTGCVVGYVTTRDTSPHASQIGLIAVDRAARGRGLGLQLADTAKQWSAARGHTSLSVVTQGRNAAALRFYERLGFETQSAELWYHRWR